MTTLDPCLSADELRVYIAAVQLHDAGRPVSEVAISNEIALSLIDVKAAFLELIYKGFLRSTYVPLYRVELDRAIVRREGGR